MGQIVSAAAKPKRCNKNQLNQLGVLAAGLHVLVSSDNSMNAAGQGNFDCYIVGNGKTAANALALQPIADSTPTANSKNSVTSSGVYNAIEPINVYLDGEKTFNNAVIGSGGVITFNPITLVDEGDAVEFCTIRESTTNNNIGNAFAMNGSVSAITLRDGVLGIRNSAGSWVDGYNASTGRASVNATYNGNRKFKLVIENGNLSLYTTYNSVTTLTESKPKSGTIQIDSLCGSYSGAEWVGTLVSFVYTHGGESKDVTMLDGFATSGDVTINWNETEGAKEKIAQIEEIKADVLLLNANKASKAELASVEENFYANTQILNFPIKDGRVAVADGSISTSTTYKYVELSVIGKNYKDIIYNAGIAGNNTICGFWLNDDTWVGTTADAVAGMHTVSVPENAKTFVVCWSVNYIENKQQSQIIYASVLQTIQDALNAADVKKAHLPIRFKHDLSLVPEQQAIDTANFGDLSYLYGLYDTLMASHTAYISKEECSADGVTKPSYLDGMSIYLYKFSPITQAKNAAFKQTLVLPKVLIFTGTHPDEYMGHFTIFKMMKMICDEWDTIDDCNTLRTQAEFYIVPCLNPWGYVNNSRLNGNGVNLNRNFPSSDWKLVTTPANDYSGTEAGSEYETKIAMKYVQEIHPDIIMDAHTGNMGAGGIFGAFNVLRNNPELANSAQIACKRVVSQWIKGNSNFGNSPDVILINEGYWGATGELFVWAGETLDGCLSTLTEQSIENKWVNGVYSSSNVGEEYTDRIYREQLQFMYESFMGLIETASMKI